MIYLVRHGQDEDNAAGLLNGHRDRPLTRLGEQQATELASKLRNVAIDLIFTSPLQRAYRTASIIRNSRPKYAPITAIDELKERDFGSLSGTPIAELDRYNLQRFPTGRINYVLDFPGGEDFPTCYRRAQQALGKIIRQAIPDHNALIVTHGDLGKMLRAAYHGWDWQRGLKEPYFDNCAVLELHSDRDTIT